MSRVNMKCFFICVCSIICIPSARSRNRPDIVNHVLDAGFPLVRIVLLVAVTFIDLLKLYTPVTEEYVKEFPTERGKLPMAFYVFKDRGFPDRQGQGGSHSSGAERSSIKQAMT